LPGFILALGVALCALPAFAHSDNPHAPKVKTISEEKYDWGQQGDPRMAKRTITVDMRDTMRFSPSAISVKRGETVRFKIRNAGKVMHEWVLGTKAEIEKHAELMKKFPDMEHDDPYMAHVKPGATGDIVWTFIQPGEFVFACLLPGHFEAGMKGTILVAP
jgi:uncharacterized cupredoxin-like copper-binding protein